MANKLSASKRRQLFISAVRKKRLLTEPTPPAPGNNMMLREDDSRMLREDGSYMLREG